MDKQERVLVVEDDGRVRQALFDLLTSWGYSVKTAENGVEGLEAIASFHPVVVLSDLQMPGLNGLELLKVARSSSPDILFLMLTGHGSIASAVEATKLGALIFWKGPSTLAVCESNCGIAWTGVKVNDNCTSPVTNVLIWVPSADWLAALRRCGR